MKHRINSLRQLRQPRFVSDVHLYNAQFLVRLYIRSNNLIPVVFERPVVNDISNGACRSVINNFRFIRFDPFPLHSHTVGVCAVSNLITRNEKDIYENPDQENR